ncbi:MAG: long-chain fatty acid--CoA ligase [Alphaproteobacteria bacterium]|nr:long-chain fatty acid--CoA ligase [Alphaproteobacteria bacterium]
MLDSSYRLFDCVEHQLKKFPKDNMLNAKENGVWRSYSTQEVQTMVNGLSCGLLKLGLNGQDLTPENAHKIAIISNNRPEWLITDLAVQQTGCILIPLYPTTSDHEIVFILNQAEVQCVFISSEEFYLKIIALKNQLPFLKYIYSFNEVKNCNHWKELITTPTEAALENLIQWKQRIGRSHLPTIIYTSGTTGNPKGVMLSHDNICFNIYSGKTSLPFEDNPNFKALSFLPLNHIFEKVASYIYMFSGMAIYFAESIETIGANMLEVKPDVFTSVPRLLEKVFEKIMNKGAALTGFKKQLFYWAVRLGDDFEYDKKQSFIYKLKLSIAKKLIFSKWEAALGGNIKYIITGGAACQPKILRIFNTAGIPTYEGYGPTENSPIICVNRMLPGQAKIGTVGPPANLIQVKISSDGEILVSGPCVMKGYYKQPELTAETVIDGWLYTGDIGVWIDDKFIQITDRKKQLMKTSGGKYVAPQPIENKLKESRFIENIMVVGDGKKFVSALIIPNFNQIIDFLKKQNLLFDSTPESLIKYEPVLQLIQNEVNSFNPLFNHVEQIKKITLLSKEWSVEGGEMTPKMSLKRKDILQKYQASIEGMYATESFN